MELNIFHMYPDQLNLYGDKGNITCLKKRANDRNINVNITKFSKESKTELENGDLFFIGGGGQIDLKN